MPQGWYTSSDLAAVTGRPYKEILGLNPLRDRPGRVVDGTLPIPLFDDSTVAPVAKLLPDPPRRA